MNSTPPSPTIPTEPERSTASEEIAPRLFDTAIVSLTDRDQQLSECELTCQIPLDIYQTIERHSLFNLKPELRNQSIVFSDEADITLKATLHPDRLPDLAEHATSSETALHYLQQLSQTQPDHPLLNLDNWFVLSAQQGDLSYTTLWATLNPSKLAAGTINEAELEQSLSQFLLQLTETELSKAADQFSQDLFNGFTDLFKGNPNNAGDHLITQTMIRFFTEDDWTFTKIQGQPILQMGYQGENGQWMCYARANEDPQQFAFYSVYPVVVPDDRKFAIAEFITRANSGLVLGNFEFNFDNGEILYKTSIDVEGDRLTSALIKRLVYTNVVIMDQYLPGINAVLENASPESAIAQIE
jgi:hypothetical protein